MLKYIVGNQYIRYKKINNSYLIIDQLSPFRVNNTPNNIAEVD